MALNEKEKKDFIEKYRSNYPEFIKSCRYLELDYKEVKKEMNHDREFKRQFDDIEKEKFEEVERQEYERGLKSPRARKKWLETKKKEQEGLTAEGISQELMDRAEEYIDLEYSNAVEQIKELCKTNLKFLCREVLNFRDWDTVHDEIAEFLELNDDKCKLIMIPRKHLKSSMVTVGKSIQWILRDPNIRILIGNAVWDVARNFLYQIVGFMEGKSELTALFGDFKSIKRWTRDEIEIKQRKVSLPAPTIATTGVGGTQTGQHYDKIILDDLVGRENIGTPEQIEKVKDFYKDCLNLVEEEKDVFVLGTTWTQDDLYNDLRQSPDFNVFVRKAIKKDGTVLFPKKFNLEKLERIKRNVGIYKFSAQYLLDPYPVEKQEFKAQWFKKYKVVPQEDMFITVVLDPSLGKKTGDYCGITCTGITAEGNIYILEARRFKRSQDLIPVEVAETCKRWHPDVLALEAFGMQQLLEKPIKEYLHTIEELKYLYLDLLPRNTHIDKNSRILGLIPSFYAGFMYMREEMKDLQDELKRFKPNIRTNKDDIIDSLAWHVRYWHRKPKPSTKRVTKEGTLGYYLKQLGRKGDYHRKFFEDMEIEDNSPKIVH
jgi:hypothetical protein